MASQVLARVLVAAVVLLLVVSLVLTQIPGPVAP